MLDFLEWPPSGGPFCNGKRSARRGPALPALWGGGTGKGSPCGAMEAQSICNRQVRGSNPLWGSKYSAGLIARRLADMRILDTKSSGRPECQRTDRKVNGGVGEWLKPPDCKSGVRKGFAGSNPAPSTISSGISSGLKIADRETAVPYLGFKTHNLFAQIAQR